MNHSFDMGFSVSNSFLKGKKTAFKLLLKDNFFFLNFRIDHFTVVGLVPQDLSLSGREAEVNLLLIQPFSFSYRKFC